jgi:hypothetical protein
MSVPTHNLYDFVHRVTKNRFLLQYFYPYSSRYLKDCINILCNDWTQGPNNIDIKHRFDQFLEHESDMSDSSLVTLHPVLFCHDQEPLFFDYYSDEIPHMQEFCESVRDNQLVSKELKNLNLRWVHPLSLQKTWILLHSELNSDELNKYESTGSFIGAYWWSHAMLSLDWYRFAQHDPALHITNEYKKLFLIYCRDNTGSRTYRKTFISNIEKNNIIDDCQLGSFLNYNITADSSAIYDAIDHNQTAISVVLETIFDNRIHLTEKTLRPLACGHPFILAAGPGSLALLKKYGFQTFSPYIDETYDTVQDNDLRLQLIVKEMKRIKLLSDSERTELITQCNQIAEINKAHYFSKDFFNRIVNELQENVAAAFNQHQGQLDLSLWWQERKKRKKNPLIPNTKKTKLLFYLLRLFRSIRQSKST